MAAARITESFAVREIPGVDRDGRQLVKTMEPLEYHFGEADSECVIVVPAGFITDFASVPRFARGLFPALGRWGRPAIIHDFLYWCAGDAQGSAWRMLPTGLSAPELDAYDTLKLARPEINDRTYTRLEADRIFLEAMEVVGVPAWRRALMFRAVRIGGGKGWGS